ncbi:MAG: hypothetical protein ACRDRJ_44605 [Streptosporangiaceae bacterium]
MSAPQPATGTGEWPGIEDAAGLLAVRVGAWNEFGYAEPPEPHCQPIPPLGERSAEAIRGGHGAIQVIDEIIAGLHRLRSQLIGEMRTDEDVRAARIDALLAATRAAREAGCSCWPGHCSRGLFADHQGEGVPDGCMACADLDPDQPCIADAAGGAR